jgi:diguanylate cyclase (GGDEF)-like protein
MNKKLPVSHWFNDDLFDESLLKGFLLVVGVSCLILVSLNLLAEYYIIAFIETMLLILTVVVWFLPRQWHFYRWVVFFYVSFIFSGILIAVALSPLFSGRQVWVLIFPMSAYLMLGRRIAVWLSGVCLALVAIILYLRFYEPHGIQLVSVVINLVFAYLFLWGLTHSAEKIHKKMLATLTVVASTDPLTGLANRRNMIAKYEQQFKTAKKNGDGLAVVLIDLDHFKRVNDNYGHDIGDAVLVDFAERLRAHEGDSEQLFRLGGEEFCVLMSVSKSKAWAVSFCQYIHDTPFRFNGHDICYTASIGVSSSNEDGGDFKHLYSIADQRLYKAKNSGRNCVVLEG